MNHYWNAFLTDFPHASYYPLIVVLEAFWKYCEATPWTESIPAAKAVFIAYEKEREEGV